MPLDAERQSSQAGRCLRRASGSRPRLPPPRPPLGAPQLVVFEGCGHMPQEECPERFVQEVRRFVAALGPAEGEQAASQQGAAAEP